LIDDLPFHCQAKPKKLFVRIQLIEVDKKDKTLWHVKGYSFNKLHEVVIDCKDNNCKIVAKEIKIFRGGLRAVI